MAFPARSSTSCGVYRLTPKGELTLLTKEMSKPNGIAFSPDEKTLYVANSDPLKAIWMKFPVKEDGTLGEGKVFFDATPSVAKLKGLPDGMKVDKDGNIFATGPGGVLVFAPDGTHLGHAADRRADGQLRLGRRRQRAVHHRRQEPDPHQDADEGQGVLRHFRESAAPSKDERLVLAWRCGLASIFLTRTLVRLHSTHPPHPASGDPPCTAASSCTLPPPQSLLLAPPAPPTSRTTGFALPSSAFMAAASGW